MPVQVIPCKCNNQYQDATYGKGMRVHNQTTKGVRCTSCGDHKLKPQPTKTN